MWILRFRFNSCASWLRLVPWAIFLAVASTGCMILFVRGGRHWVAAHKAMWILAVLAIELAFFSWMRFCFWVASHWIDYQKLE